MILYATVSEFEAYTGTSAPADIERRIREATAAVKVATRSDRYRVQPNGLPSDDDVREALRSATCAQVAQRIDDAAEVAALPGGGIVTSSSIDGATVQLDTSIAATRRAAAQTNALCGAAYAILRAAGLASAAVQ